MRWKGREVGLCLCLLLISLWNEGLPLSSKNENAGLMSEPERYNFSIPKPAAGCPTLTQSVHKEVDYTFSRTKKAHNLETFIEENHNALQVLDGDYGKIITRVGFCVYDDVEWNSLFDEIGGVYIFSAYVYESDYFCPAGFQPLKWKDERIHGDLISDNVGRIYSQVDDDWFIQACELTQPIKDQNITAGNSSFPIPFIVLQNGFGNCRQISQTARNGSEHTYNPVEFKLGESVFCYYIDLGSLLGPRDRGVGFMSDPERYNFSIPKPAAGCPTLPQSVHREVDYTFSRTEIAQDLETFTEENHNALQVLDGDYGEIITRVGFCFYDNVEWNPMFYELGGLFIFRAYTSDYSCPEGFQPLKWKDGRIHGDLISENVGRIYSQVDNVWFIQACELTQPIKDKNITAGDLTFPIPFIVLQNGIGKCRHISQTSVDGIEHTHNPVEFKIEESVFCYYNDLDIQIQLHWDHSPTMALPLNKGIVALRVGHKWGRICCDDFSATAAGVACFQLGFSRNGAQVFETGRQRTQIIHTLDFFCNGTEGSLNDCDVQMNNTGPGTCHQVGIACEARRDAPSPFGIRDGSLQDFQISLSAQAELKSDGRVCQGSTEQSKVTVKFDTVSEASLTGVDIHVHHLEERCGGGGKVLLYIGTSSNQSLASTSSFTFRAQDERVFRTFSPLQYASFIQVTFTGIECLSIELIGYRQFIFDNIDIDCGEGSIDLGWLNTNEVYVPLIEILKDEFAPTEDAPIVNTTEDCQSMCQNADEAYNCIAVAFTDTCKLYRHNDEGPFAFLRRITSAQRICIAGTNQTHDQNLAIRTFGPIQSMGYPFGYDTDVLYTYHIRFSEGHYIDVVFEVISLRQPVGERTNNCEDVIQMDGIALNSKQNNVQQRYIFANNTLTMEFKSCPRTLRSETQDKGFRAYVFPTEILLCTLLCKIEKGFLIPSSYFGRLLTSQLVTWKFEHDGDVHIDFLQFDIACELSSRGSWLTINGIQYCNLKKPPKQLHISQGHCEISFFNMYSQAYRQYGFIAKFEARKAFSKMEAWTSETDHEVGWRPGADRCYRYSHFMGIRRDHVPYSRVPLSDNPVPERKGHRPIRSFWGYSHHLYGPLSRYPGGFYLINSCRNKFKFRKVESCSKKIGQCFEFYRYETSESLSVLERMCEKKGKLLSMKNREEMEFVAYHLWKTWKVSAVPIGLVTKMANDGTLTYRWVDGSPLFFRPSSFIPGDKIDQTYEMKIDKFHTITWLPLAPDKVRMSKFVCKRPMKKKQISDTGQTENTIQPNRQSNYYRCWNNEIIALSSVCDGQIDCVDGSDEINCTKTDCRHDKHFQCDDGTCIPISMYCDGRNDCPDSSDEQCYKAFILSLSETTKAKRRGARWFNPKIFRYSEQAENTASGLLQIGYKEKTYHVCSDDLNKEDLPIVCQELGYSRSNGSLEYMLPVSKPLINVEFNCSGTKTYLTSCIRVNSASKCESNRTMEITCTSAQPAVAENNSTVLKIKSCSDLWRAGKRSSGFYRVGKDGHFIECRFEEVWRNNKIWAYLHDFDIRRNEDSITGLQSDYDADVLSYYNKLKCNQSIIQTCKQPTDTIPGACLCIEVVLKYFPAQRSPIQDILPCSNTTSLIYNELDADWLKKKLIFSVNFGKDFFFTLDVHVSEMGVNTVLRLGPLICQEDIIPENTTHPCDSGPTVPIATRCLYDIDRRRNIVGCRDMSHLKDCEQFSCPKDFVKCPKSYCVPIRFLCDGISNCPNSEDEEICENARPCPNQYRCKNATFCLPTSQLCDGTPHCPEEDDERFCDMSCPEGCECEGYAVRCSMSKLTEKELHQSMPQTLRSLDFSLNNQIVALRTPLEMPFAVYINLSFCEINHIEPYVFDSLKNLKILDLSHNKLTRLYSNTFAGLTRCSRLLLDGNPSINQIEPWAFSGLQNLKELVVKNTNIATICLDTFKGLLSLIKLDISSNQIHTVEEGGFDGLKELKELSMSKNQILHFTDNIFGGLEHLERLHSDEYRFCCFKPETVTDEDCHPHRNEFSSCTDLMRKDELRFFMWIIGIFALMGNLLSLVYRFTTDRKRLKIGYGIFVTNLSIADFCMGFYLLIIAGADAHYRGRYIENDKIWRFSNICTTAGIISTISSEASVFFICLITVDRILVIKYPFGNFRFTPQSAVLSSVLTWVFAAFIATLPVVYIDYFKNGFYARSGVCLALPLTRDRPNGWEYSLTIFVFFNFLTFLLIALGQWMIYREMKSSRVKSSASTKRKNDLTVAKNLLMVVSTDFLCWCPIGVMGIMSLLGEPISGDVYAWAAVLILPINSALNPFLYTFSAIIRKKKFVPSLTEQDRLTERETVLIKRNLEIARNRWIQPLKLPRSLPLTQYLKDHALTPKEIILLTRKVAKVLDFLHRRHVFHGKLDINCIAVVVRNGVIRDAVIKLDPQLIERRRGDKGDIESVGLLINKLMEFKS